MSAAPPFLTRVRIRNYRSIAACDVELGSLAFLVGPNGSGKSNFLDAIRFVADALDSGLADNETPLERALRTRGQLDEVLHAGPPYDSSFSIRLDFQTPGGLTGHYSLQIGRNDWDRTDPQEKLFLLKQEECDATDEKTGERHWFRVYPPEGYPYAVDPPLLRCSITNENQRPSESRVRLNLGLCASYEAEPFRTIAECLRRIRFYRLNPDTIRAPQLPDREASLLREDGANLVSVFESLERLQPATKKRIEDYLSFIVPGTHAAIPVWHHERRAGEPLIYYPDGGKSVPSSTDGRVTLNITQGKRRLPLASMSDGTLRALGILTALLQDSDGPPTLVGIEEPETALHPAALAALIDAFQDAREQTQVLVTTHSTDLLHFDEVRTDELLGVSAETGATVIGGVDKGSRKVLHDRLFTAGDLLRLNKLPPDKTTVSSSRQINFFDL